jgi:hypothetical protein
MRSWRRRRALKKKRQQRGIVYFFAITLLLLFASFGWSLSYLGVKQPGRSLKLDELDALIKQKAGRPGQYMESDAFLGEFGKIAGGYRAARALVKETWVDVEQTLEAGEPPSVRQHTLIRMACHHATWAVHDACMFVYKSAGTTALRAGTIQRLFRDMHAGTQHIMPSPPVIQAVGKELAGLAEGQRWFFLGLAD